MSNMIVFDNESNGLLDTVSKLHCINLIDRADGREYRFNDHEFYCNADGTLSDVPTGRDGTIKDGLEMLANAELIGGHNIIDYDLPAQQIVYPGWETKAEIMDSLVMTRVMYTNIKDLDFSALRSKRLSKDFQRMGLIGRHSLKAWAIRIGDKDSLKADFDPKTFGHTWATIPFIKEMDDYCMQDVRANVKLYEFLEAKQYSEECLKLENDTAKIIARQHRVGFELDVKKINKLIPKYQSIKVEMEETLRDVFTPWYTWDGKDRGRFTPKRDNKKLNYKAGCPMSKVKLVIFNPGSRDQIASRLKKIHGWKPTEFTPKGGVKIDEEVLGTLPYPEAKKLTTYLTIQKRLSQMCDGKGSWTNFLKGTRVHGRVNSNGAVTGRMTHNSPNTGNVDKHPDMRGCWTVRPGYKLVGCDADGLELRCLAHYMALYDGGEYARTVVEGTKEEGTDAHTLTQVALNLNSRDVAKTWMYAFLYGSGDFNLGNIVLSDFDEDKKARFYAKFPPEKRKAALSRLGRNSRNAIAKKFPALDTLVEKVKANAAKRGYLKGLDGRKLHVRSAHSALNTLLQGCGAVIMKKALVILEEDLQAAGFTHSESVVDGKVVTDWDYDFVANVHDEFQQEVKEEHAERVAKLASDSIRKAGEQLNLRCVLAGGADIGNNWSETH